MTCPVPNQDYDRILLAHGGGGRLTQRLLERLFRPAFDNELLATRHDGAALALGADRLAFTTDSYVVRPLFFPGGDIGRLAVCGTVNDLAMCGARPLWLSAGFILEEGLAVDDLRRVVESMRRAASDARVQLVTADTKVVDRGKGDGIYINTAGLGRIIAREPIGPASVRPGDAVLLSGDIGRHGITIMAARDGLAFESPLESDCAPLHEPVLELIADGLPIHCLRDLTRGGLAAGLIEMAQTTGVDFEIDEEAIPIVDAVRGASELLGLDPLNIANEGRFLVILPERNADAALATLGRCDVARGACRIGRVTGAGRGETILRSRRGTRRVLDLFSGEQLPRIC